MGWIEDISSYLGRLSHDQISAAVAQVDARGFNRDRQPLDFDTAIERLRWCRDTIQGALDNFATTLPQRILQEVRDALGNTASPVDAIAAGNDQVSALVGAVDALHTVIWRNRIAEKASRVINLAEKVDHLSRLSAEVQKLRADLAALLKKAAGIGDQLQQSREAASAAAQARQEAEAARLQATQQAREAETARTEAADRNKQVNEFLGQARTAQQEITTIKEGLKRLYSEGAEFRKRVTEAEEQLAALITETRERSDQTISEHATRTEALLQTLEANEQRTTDALEKATGVSLFHAFEQRRKEIARWKWIWPVAALAAAVVTIVVALRLALTCSSFDPAFYFKLAVTIPVALVIWFCIAQYNRERRLEEEYAFKSKISLSLEAYRKLVETVLPDGDEASKAKYSDFIIDAVDKVFTAPVDHKDELDLVQFKSLTADQMKQLAEIVHIVWQGKK